MKRIFSGIKPTGDLHIGNYLGAIRNWLKLQDEYDCLYAIVDNHAMTTRYEADKLEEKVIKVAANYLACGLDPNKSTLMVQSTVKAHTELTWILNCLTPISWLQRVPTYKEKSRQNADNLNMGLLDYPALMAADIMLYKAEAVPVGEDQLPHLELTREILRRFNNTFGDTFPEPKDILSSGARIKGLDGSEKMGKSLNNCIYLFDDKKEISKKLSQAVTDPARVKKTDPGTPEKCNVNSLHKLFSDDETLKEVFDGCTKATIGCVKCKKWLAKNMAKELEPIREKYFDYLDNVDYIRDILVEGNKKANIIAETTMEEVREKVGINYKFLK